MLIKHPIVRGKETQTSTSKETDLTTSTSLFSGDAKCKDNLFKVNIFKVAVTLKLIFITKG